MKNIVIFAGGHGGIKLQQSIAKYARNNVNVDIDNSYWNKTLIGVNNEKGIPYLTSIGYNNITIQNMGTDNVVLQGLYFHKLS